MPDLINGTPADAFGTKKMELILAKNRQGQLGIVRVIFRGSVMRIVEDV